MATNNVLQAWSSTLRKLIPNVKKLDKCVQQLGNIMEGHEILLFDRATFLVISSYKQVLDEEDKSSSLSFALKKFKLSCRLIIILSFFEKCYFVCVFKTFKWIIYFE